MSYSVSGTTITLTRGDTFMAQISIVDKDGNTYVPVEGDTVRFAMKQKYTDLKPLLVKDIPTDTKSLAFGNYVYDIQLTKASGEVDTFITTSKIKITEEVD